MKRQSTEVGEAIFKLWLGLLKEMGGGPHTSKWWLSIVSWVWVTSSSADINLRSKYCNLLYWKKCPNNSYLKLLRFHYLLEYQDALQLQEDDSRVLSAIISRVDVLKISLYIVMVQVQTSEINEMSRQLFCILAEFSN